MLFTLRPSPLALPLFPPPSDVAASVVQLCQETGVEVPAAAASGDASAHMHLLSELVGRVQSTVGVA